MSKDKTGGPAFPVAELDGDGEFLRQYTGLTMRDYFAAKAMQGMLANKWNQNYESWAQHAYMMADAMLEARK
jgi:hypothetical protein